MLRSPLENRAGVFRLGGLGAPAGGEPATPGGGTDLSEFLRRARKWFPLATELSTDQVQVNAAQPAPVVTTEDPLRVGLGMITPASFVGNLFLGNEGVTALRGFGPLPGGLVWLFGAECPSSVWLITDSGEVTVGVLSLRASA